jgi:two-component system, OmpR family, sensor kinase
MPYADSDGRLLALLEQLLDLPALALEQALTGAATAVAQWLNCDKVDVFLFDPPRTSLVALGTSQTPLGEKQKALGLDVLPIANGGRIASTYQTGHSFLTGHADQDEDEVPGIVRDLGARSIMNVTVEIAGQRRGVLSVVSLQPDRFDDRNLRVLELIARWVSALAQRAALVEKLREEEQIRARSATAEEIVTVLAHDIRNHLNPLNGRLQLLRLKLQSGQPLPASVLESALGAVRRMVRLTDGLLDLARLDQGLFELELAPVDLSALVLEAAAAFSTVGNEVSVTAPPSLVVVADRERLSQALDNVLANAVRHSPKDAPVRVRLEQLDKHAEIRVSDSGLGIPPEIMPRLFERFVSTRGSRGLGLGLYLASRIVQAHGGTLQAESQLGSGATFVFTLPMEGA